MPPIRIYLLSEDSSRDAHATLAALVKKMLCLVDSYCQTNECRFDRFDNSLDDVVVANQWKSKQARDPKLRKLQAELRRELATKLQEDPRYFVLWHLDGDRVWAERHTSENRAQFDECIANRVRGLVRLPKQKADGRRPRRGKFKPSNQTQARLKPDSQHVEQVMGRLLVIMPFYSIEAWTYQNTEVAKQLCRQHCTNGAKASIERFETWPQGRGQLDEQSKPKEETCLEGRHNRELAETSFPAKAVYDVGKSFHAAVATLAGCTALSDALRATHHAAWHDHGP